MLQFSLFPTDHKSSEEWDGKDENINEKQESELEYFDKEIFCDF